MVLVPRMIMIATSKKFNCIYKTVFVIGFDAKLKNSYLLGVFGALKSGSMYHMRDL
jgi:hypothetical protein